jgi:hypothetical protein
MGLLLRQALFLTESKLFLSFDLLISSKLFEQMYLSSPSAAWPVISGAS